MVLSAAGTLAYYAFRATLVSETDRSLTIAGMGVINQVAGPELLQRGGRFLKPPISTHNLLSSLAQQMNDDAYDPLGDPIYIRLFATNPQVMLLTSHNLTRHDLVQKILSPHVSLSPSATVSGYFAERSDFSPLRVVNIRFPRRPYILQLATPWMRNKETLDAMVDIIISTIGFGFALSALGGWILVGRTLRPITEIVSEASKMSGNRLEPAFVAARTMADDEIGHLVTALNGMMSRVQQALQSQRQFTADASHDLRTPLAILRGEMELALARERTGDEYRGVLISGLEEIARLTRIVNDLRELALADSGQSKSPKKAVIEILPIVENVVYSRRHYAIGKNVDLTMTAPSANERIHIDADALAIERAVLNLVDNAIDYNCPEGKVHVTLAKDGCNAVICVSDTGKGINNSDLDYIFDRFYRGDKSRTVGIGNTGSNSGLGLAIVKATVLAHGGTVSVRSEVGAGSQFSITLPITQAFVTESPAVSA